MRKWIFALPAALFAVLSQGIAARADLKLVNEVTISGLPAAVASQSPGLSAPTSTTTYYKGSSVRTETAGSITILQGSDGKLLTLDPTVKTYYVTAPGTDATNVLSSNPFASMIKIDAKATVTPTIDKKTIVGKDASKYLFTVAINITMNGDSSMAAMMPKISMSGEEWTTESVTLPNAAANLSSAMMSKFTQFPMMGGLKDLTRQFATIKGLPLAVTMTLTFAFPPDSPLAAAAGDAIPKKMVVETAVKSLSEDTLSDDLFTVPADYKLVDPPKPPTTPLPVGTPAAAPPPPA